MEDFVKAETQSGCMVECRLDCAHDLAALLTALQLRDKEHKDLRVHCEASGRGLKFIAQSIGKDVAVVGWIFNNAFKEYRYAGMGEELHLRLPVAPMLCCLQVFSDRASMVLRYPDGPSDELHFTLEEEGATTECHVKTLVLEEAPAAINSIFAPGDALSSFRPTQADTWYLALSEFADFDAPDVVLRITLQAAAMADEPAVVLRAQTVNSDAEVELHRASLEEFELAPNAGAVGSVTHSYHLSGVLSSSLRAAKEAKAVKVRFNSEGVMSSQFILRGRGQKDLFCEALVSPLAEPESGTVRFSTQVKRKGYSADESIGF